MMIKQSLRDIKREATKYALSNAAFELALERGLNGFIIEDIVQRAGYSRKTFANHFSCKEEAVAMASIVTLYKPDDQQLNEFIPENAQPLDVLYASIKRNLTAEYISKMRQLISLSKQYSSLEPYILSGFRRLQKASVETLSDLSCGEHPEGYSHLLSGAVYGAILAVFDGSLNVLLPGQTTTEFPGSTSFDNYLDTIFSYLRNGFQKP